MIEISKVPDIAEFKSIFYRGCRIYVSMDHDPILEHNGKFFVLTAPVADTAPDDWYMLENDGKLYLAMHLEFPEVEQLTNAISPH